MSRVAPQPAWENARRQGILVEAEDAAALDCPPARPILVQTAPEHFENLSLYSPESAPRASEPKREAFRLIGEVLDTYLIVEYEGEVVLIDKHAAHERILFEKLKKERRVPQPQLLLAPEHVRLSEPEITALEENDTLLIDLGFEIDRIGLGSVAVRQVPDGITAQDIPVVMARSPRRCLKTAALARKSGSIRSCIPSPAKRRSRRA